MVATNKAQRCPVHGCLLVPAYRALEIDAPLAAKPYRMELRKMLTCPKCLAAGEHTVHPMRVP